MSNRYRVYSIKKSSFAERILKKFGLALVVIGTGKVEEVVQTNETKEEFIAFHERNMGYLVISIEDI